MSLCLNCIKKTLQIVIKDSQDSALSITVSLMLSNNNFLFSVPIPIPFL
jgi:hypothetical protein